MIEAIFLLDYNTKLKVNIFHPTLVNYIKIDNTFFKGESFDWRMATLTKRPANLPDKTYGAPIGYAYFDIFNSGSRLVL